MPELLANTVAYPLVTRLSNQLLCISILLVAATLLLDKGPQDLLLDLMPVWLMGSMLSSPPTNRYAIALIIVCAGLWLPALVHSPAASLDLENLGLFLLTGLAVWQSRVLWASFQRLWNTSIPLLLIVPSFIHMAVSISRNNNTGLFSNPHYLSLALIMSIPVKIFWLHRITNLPLLKTLLVGALAVDFYLLLNTHSRPAWLALACSCLVLLPFLTPRMRTIAALSLFLVPMLLYQLDWFQFAERIDDLVINLAREERVTIWQDSWLMQKSGSFIDWLFGHGYGTFLEDFTAYSRYHPEVDFYSPHNFVLEILYAAGLWGLAVLSIGFTALFRHVLRFRQPAGPDSSLAMLLLTLLVASLLHSFLTLPLLSKETVLCLGFLVGAAGWLGTPVSLAVVNSAPENPPQEPFHQKPQPGPAD